MPFTILHSLIYFRLRRLIITHFVRNFHQLRFYISAVGRLHDTLSFGPPKVNLNSKRLLDKFPTVLSHFLQSIKCAPKIRPNGMCLYVWTFLMAVRIVTVQPASVLHGPWWSYFSFAVHRHVQLVMHRYGWGLTPGFAYFYCASAMPFRARGKYFWKCNR